MAQGIVSQSLEETQIGARLMRSQREIIYDRIHNALETGRNEGHIPEQPLADLEIPETLVRQFAATSPEGLVSRFKIAIANLGDQCVECASIKVARDWIMRQIAAREWERGGIDHDAARVLGIDQDTFASCQLAFPGDRAGLFQADFGITLADFGIAATGSVALHTDRQRSRLTSLAPDVHFALLDIKDLLPDLPDALYKMHASSTTWTWITGSSRTADIDGILIHGAHGPKELIILLIGGTGTP